MDEQKVEFLAERILGEVNTSMNVLNIYLGHKLGLYKTLEETGPVTTSELADKTGYSERYLREWLGAQTVTDFLDHDSTTDRFSISPELATVLLREEHPAYIAPFTQWIPSIALVLPELMDAFRTGGGVPYESYGQDCLDAIGLGNRPMYVNDYVSTWIPALPDVEARLKNGGKVAEVGTGVGWSTIALAKGFPTVTIDSIEIDEESVKQAKVNAEKEGVSDRITFHTTAIEKTTLTGPYDLVTAFECLHDMPYPIEALKKMRELAGPEGTVLIADEAAGDTLEENRSFLGQMFLNFSVLHCLPQAMVFPDSAGTGTAIGPATVTAYAKQAGFKSVEVLDIENPFFRFYRLSV